MGTNYYLQEKPACPTCGAEPERIHIGKSSAGWCFGLHVYPDNGISTLEDWMARWSEPGAIIWNEYGEQISAQDMLKTITGRKFGGISALDERWFAMNHAETGPNNLARHRIDERYCVGHGDGTYDLMVGEFS